MLRRGDLLVLRPVDEGTPPAARLGVELLEGPLGELDCAADHRAHRAVLAREVRDDHVVRRQRVVLLLCGVTRSVVGHRLDHLRRGYAERAHVRRALHRRNAVLPRDRDRLVPRHDERVVGELRVRRGDVGVGRAVLRSEHIGVHLRTLRVERRRDVRLGRGRAHDDRLSHEREHLVDVHDPLLARNDVVRAHRCGDRRLRDHLPHDHLPRRELRRLGDDGLVLDRRDRMRDEHLAATLEDAPDGLPHLDLSVLREEDHPAAEARDEHLAAAVLTVLLLEGEDLGVGERLGLVVLLVREELRRHRPDPVDGALPDLLAVHEQVVELPEEGMEVRVPEESDDLLLPLRHEGDRCGAVALRGEEAELGRSCARGRSGVTLRFLPVVPVAPPRLPVAAAVLLDEVGVAVGAVLRLPVRILREAPHEQLGDGLAAPLLLARPPAVGDVDGGLGIHALRRGGGRGLGRCSVGVFGGHGVLFLLEHESSGVCPRWAVFVLPRTIPESLLSWRQQKCQLQEHPHEPHKMSLVTAVIVRIERVYSWLSYTTPPPICQIPPTNGSWNQRDGRRVIHKHAASPQYCGVASCFIYDYTSS